MSRRWRCADCDVITTEHYRARTHALVTGHRVETEHNETDWQRVWTAAAILVGLLALLLT